MLLPKYLKSYYFDVMSYRKILFLYAAVNMNKKALKTSRFQGFLSEILRGHKNINNLEPTHQAEYAAFYSRHESYQGSISACHSTLHSRGYRSQ